jgi:hypothetical protein
LPLYMSRIAETFASTSGAFRRMSTYWASIPIGMVHTDAKWPPALTPNGVDSCPSTRVQDEIKCLAYENVYGKKEVLSKHVGG